MPNKVKTTNKILGIIAKNFRNSFENNIKLLIDMVKSNPKIKKYWDPDKIVRFLKFITIIGVDNCLKLYLFI